MDQSYFEESMKEIDSLKIDIGSHVGTVRKSERLSQVELIWTVESSYKEEDPDGGNVRLRSDMSILFENPDMITLNCFEVYVEWVQREPIYGKITGWCDKIAIKEAQTIISFRDEILTHKSQLDHVEIEFNLTISLKRKLLKQIFDFDPRSLDKPKHLPNPALYGNDMFSDFTFIVQHSSGERQFKVHQNVLFLASEVFTKFLKSGFKESLNCATTITDIDPDAFEVMLKFLYGVQQNFESIFNPNSSMVLLVYQAADKYEIFNLVKICLYHIMKSYVTHRNEDGSLNIGNLYETYQFAMQYGLQTLKQYCEETFQYDILKNFNLVSPELLVEAFEKAANGQEPEKQELDDN